AEVEKGDKNSLLVEDSDASFAPTNVYRDGIGVARDQQRKKQLNMAYHLKKSRCSSEYLINHNLNKDTFNSKYNDKSESEKKSCPLEINDKKYFGQFRFISQNEYVENGYHKRLTYRTTTINEEDKCPTKKIDEENLDDQINILRKSCFDEYDSLSCNLDVIEQFE
ncbi:19223_t:CDS:2, partial [Gigaspora rosea]